MGEIINFASFMERKKAASSENDNKKMVEMYQQDADNNEARDKMQNLAEKEENVVEKLTCWLSEIDEMEKSYKDEMKGCYVAPYKGKELFYKIKSVLQEALDKREAVSKIFRNQLDLMNGGMPQNENMKTEEIPSLPVSNKLAVNAQEHKTVFLINQETIEKSDFTMEELTLLENGLQEIIKRRETNISKLMWDVEAMEKFDGSFYKGKDDSIFRSYDITENIGILGKLYKELMNNVADSLESIKGHLYIIMNKKFEIEKIDDQN